MLKVLDPCSNGEGRRLVIKQLKGSWFLCIVCKRVSVWMCVERTLCICSECRDLKQTPPEK